MPFLAPEKLHDYTPAEILDALSRGHLGADHRTFHALLDRPQETLQAAIDFGNRDRSKDKFDIASELLALFRYLKSRRPSLPFALRERRAGRRSR